MKLKTCLRKKQAENLKKEYSRKIFPQNIFKRRKKMDTHKYQAGNKEVKII